jgi:Uma2 family endonuclease
MTIAEWAELAEDVPGELISGRLVEEEVPDYVHELIVAWLVRILGNWAEENGAIVGGSEAKLMLSRDRGRKADTTVYLAGRRPPRRGAIRIPPDIAIEVVSPSARDRRRDRVEKPDEYAAFGIRWYWLVDPEERTLDIYELGGDGRYRPVLTQITGGVHEVPGCTGLTLDLDAMWAKADELAD